jgi:hypothetical protein
MSAVKLGTTGRDASSGQITVPDAPHQVLAGWAGGLHWAVHVGLDRNARLSTSVTRIWRDGSTTFSVPGSGPPDGQLISMWIGREPAIPPLLMLKARPGVTHATAVLTSRDRRQVVLSSVIEDFGLRFGVVSLPEEDPLAALEIGCWPGGIQIIELWRPPVRL